MSDDFVRRPHLPLLDEENVMLAVLVGADCPHKLARLFDVHVLNPDLVGIVNALSDAGAIRAGERPFGHLTPAGSRCRPIVPTPETPDQHS